MIRGKGADEASARTTVQAGLNEQLANVPGAAVSAYTDKSCFERTKESAPWRGQREEQVQGQDESTFGEKGVWGDKV